MEKFSMERREMSVQSTYEPGRGTVRSSVRYTESHCSQLTITLIPIRTPPSSPQGRPPTSQRQESTPSIKFRRHSGTPVIPIPRIPRPSLSLPQSPSRVSSPPPATYFPPRRPSISLPPSPTTQRVPRNPASSPRTSPTRAVTPTSPPIQRRSPRRRR